ncbi:MAG TPA: PAS domain-containing protein, partial [Verrucomicrobiae bacterium]|nr:PAS domain-containing protein [Verrucomicrobiae bacterium]
MATARTYEHLTREELIALLEERDRFDHPPQDSTGEAEGYRHLMEQAADGILISNAEGVYIDANESAARLLGGT